MIVIVQSLDTSLAFEKEAGFFEETRSRYEIFREFGQVVLLTQDSQDFSPKFAGIVHIPCAFSKSAIIARLLLRSTFTRWFYFFISCLVWLIKNNQGIDLLVTDNIDSPAALIISRVFRIPYLIYYRYDVGSQIKWINGRSIIGTIVLAEEKLAFRRVEKLWVTSPHLARYAEKLGRKKHTTVIQNWIGAPHIFQSKTKEPPTSTVPLILFVGRLHKVKQVDLLLRAFHILHQTNPDVQVHIIGDGEEAQRLKKLTEVLGLSGHVHFLGFVERETVVEMMRKAAVFVLPSKIEGNPRVLIEAMMCKVPIVAMNVPGIRDMIQNMKNGYLINKPDPEELANAIKFVLEHKNFSSAMAECAYEFAIEDFSKEGALKKIREDLAFLQSGKHATYREVSQKRPRSTGHNK